MGGQRCAGSGADGRLSIFAAVYRVLRRAVRTVRRPSQSGADLVLLSCPWPEWRYTFSQRAARVRRLRRGPGAAPRRHVLCLVAPVGTVMNHTIRQATLSDVETLVRLMKDFYAEADFELPETSAARTFAALLDDWRYGQVWLVEVEGQAVGFVVLTVSFSMEYGGLRGFVDDFFIAPKHRNKGLGHAALEEVKRACGQRGVRALLVEVGPQNDAALSAYKHVGFADTGHALLKLQLAPAVHQRV